MGKSRNPRSQTIREPNEKDRAINQQAPRLYRLFTKQQDIKQRKKQETEPKVSLKSRKIGLKSSKTVKEQLTQIQKKQNTAEFRKTKKYQKKQAYLNKKKNQVEVLDRGQILEKKLVDKVKFNDVVKEPPKITFKPKAKVYIPKEHVKKEEIHTTHRKGVPLKKVGRAIKLREMLTGDRSRLEDERERVIALYRKNKK